MHASAPWELGHGPHGWAEPVLVPFLGMLLLALTLSYLLALIPLLRSGTLGVARSGPPRPEDEAKRVLAERFAKGDLSSEDFMERASLLNWTPGVDVPAPALRWLRRR